MSDCAVLFVIGVLIRLVFVLIPPRDGLYNVDELMMSLMVLDRWLNLPPINLAWPAVPLQFMGLIVTTPKFIYSLMADRHLSQFNVELFNSYLDPKAIIVSLRILTILFASGTGVLLYRIALSLSEQRLPAILIAILGTSTPFYFNESLMATTDVVAVFFGALSAYIIVTKPAKISLAAGTVSLAISSKIIVVGWLAPILLAGFISIWLARGFRVFAAKLAQFLLILLVGLILFLPYIWISPVAMTKAILGNLISNTGTGIPSVSILGYKESGIFGVMALLSLCLGCGALSFARPYRVWGSVIGTGTSLLILILWHSGFQYWRYFLGAIIPCGFLVAIFMRRYGGRVAVSGAVAISLLMILVALWGQIDQRRGVGLLEMFTYLNDSCKPGTTIWLDEDLLNSRYDRVPLTTSALADITSGQVWQAQSAALTDWLIQNSFSELAAETLQTDFDAVEQAYRARWRGVASILKPSYCEVQLFQSGSRDFGTKRNLRHGSITLNDWGDVTAAVAAAGERRIAIIGPDKLVRKLGLPLRMSSSDDQWLDKQWSIVGHF